MHHSSKGDDEPTKKKSGRLSDHHITQMRRHRPAKEAKETTINYRRMKLTEINDAADLEVLCEQASIQRFSIYSMNYHEMCGCWLERNWK